MQVISLRRGIWKRVGGEEAGSEDEEEEEEDIGRMSIFWHLRQTTEVTSCQDKDDWRRFFEKETEGELEEDGDAFFRIYD